MFFSRWLCLPENSIKYRPMCLVIDSLIATLKKRPETIQSVRVGHFEDVFANDVLYGLVFVATVIVSIDLYTKFDALADEALSAYLYQFLSSRGLARSL